MLPRLVIPCSPAEALARLEAAARRGKLAGFHRPQRGDGSALFTVTDFGHPFESVLLARSDSPSEDQTILRFDLRLRPKLAWVYLLVLILTVWPGVWLTDSMLRTYFSGYDYRTWMWYLPLTVPFVPWGMWVAVRRSRTSARVEAMKIIQSIAALVEGRLQPASAAGQSGGAAPARPTTEAADAA